MGFLGKAASRAGAYAAAKGSGALEKGRQGAILTGKEVGKDLLKVAKGEGANRSQNQLRKDGYALFDMSGQAGPGTPANQSPVHEWPDRDKRWFPSMWRT